MTTVMEPEVRVEPKVIPTTIHETLFKAADLLEKGWIANMRWNPARTHYCALGAIQCADGSAGSSMDLTDLERNSVLFLAKQLERDPMSYYAAEYMVAVWSNEGPPSKVVSGFRRAAMVAEVLGV